jgi:hypothetical protein
VANEPRPVTAADLEAIVDLGFARCGWRPTSQEPWRIQGLGASENGQQDDDLLMSFYAEDIDRVGDALDKDDMRSGHDFPGAHHDSAKFRESTKLRLDEKGEAFRTRVKTKLTSSFM